MVRLRPVAFSGASWSSTAPKVVASPSPIPTARIWGTGARSAFRLETYRLTSHPQEISENAVDVSHFSVLHGYSEVKMRDEIVF